MSDHDLFRARVALAELELRRERAWNAWIKHRIGSGREREARRVIDRIDEDLAAHRNRVRRLEAESNGQRWLRLA